LARLKAVRWESPLFPDIRIQPDKSASRNVAQFLTKSINNAEFAAIHHRKNTARKSRWAWLNKIK
jgi:hypothetical protein